MRKLSCKNTFLKYFASASGRLSESFDFGAVDGDATLGASSPSRAIIISSAGLINPAD